MDTNCVHIQGTVIAAREREFPGGTAWAFTVQTCNDDECTSSETVPVIWHDWASSHRQPPQVGEEVNVTGKVATRFFRVGGATQSRCEVIADRVR
jgi:predicted extracellular nuclease